MLGQSLDVLQQCVAIDVSGDTELDGVHDAGGLSAWLGRRHQQRCEGAEATAPSAVLLTGPPAAGKTSLLNQIIVLTLNQSDTELIPILVKVQLLQDHLLKSPDGTCLRPRLNPFPAPPSALCPRAR